MLAQILKNPPISGGMEEILFEAFGKCTWVKFFDTTKEWAGAFGNGYSSNAKEFAVFHSGNHAFIITKGKRHLINLRNRSLVLQVGRLLRMCAPLPEPDVVIVLDTGRAWISCNSSGMLWESEFRDANPIQIPLRY